MSKTARGLLVLAIIAVVAVCVWAFMWFHRPPPLDEAAAAGKTVAFFPQADEDYFKAMDGGVALSPDEVKGRNTWMIWTAGNDAFWDYLADNSYGALDLLKTISSHRALPWKGRSERFHYLGLVNEPGFTQATGPDSTRYGLWLDKRTGPPDPYENAAKYPGVNGGSAYGWATGVMGLRLFPNPAFDGAAARKWDPVRYYTDPSYYNDKNLIRPYRVGMSCGFCHIGFDPTRPPKDPEAPEWRNLSSYIGAQYFWVGRIFYYNRDAHSYIWQLFQSPRPGALDTSLISNDSINNPRTMNAIFNVKPRLEIAHRVWHERLAGDELLNGQLPGDFIPPDMVSTPRVLKEGADSVGLVGALNRVFVNIGEFHQEWIRHFKPLIGGPETPIRISTLNANSVYWNATAERMPNMAQYFLKAAVPYRLADAPGGRAYMTTDTTVLNRGKIVFAENCMRCHSSKQPPNWVPGSGAPSAATLDWYRREVVKPDFLSDNFLSTDERHPITEIGINACSPVASNAIRDHIWDSFSSETYKNLPPVGRITVTNPVTNEPSQWTVPGGGRGYVRPASLISVWATAPLLQNNELGKFVNDTSVAAHMESFNDSIEQLLWPEKRKPRIAVTSDVSYITVAHGYLPNALQSRIAENLLQRLFPSIVQGGDLRIGPIPKGTPINLIANVNLDGADPLELATVVIKAKNALKRIETEHMNDQQSTELLKTLVPDLLKVSACPDFVLNRGHEFGKNLSDNDKRAVIEFVKTF